VETPITAPAADARQGAQANAGSRRLLGDFDWLTSNLLRRRATVLGFAAGVTIFLKRYP
jgi:hypothetical protein